MEPNRQRMVIRGKTIAYWIPKATDTHSEYVTLIAFPVQQWLHDYASVSHYMYGVHLVSM